MISHIQLILHLQTHQIKVVHGFHYSHPYEVDLEWRVPDTVAGMFLVEIKSVIDILETVGKDIRVYAQPFYVLRKTKFYAAVKKGVCTPSYVIPKLYLHLWSNLWKGCRIDLFTRFPLYIVGWCIALRSPKIIMFLFIEVQIYEKSSKSMNYNCIYWNKQA